MSKHEQLKQLVKRDAVRFGKFILASGKESDFYADLRKVTLNAQGATLIGEIIAEMIKDHDVQAVGGMTMGADPIATASSVACYRAGREVHAFIVRKEVKDHGTGRLVEGPVKEGDRVVVVEDVITTGGSTLKAIERIEAAGLVVDCVIAVLDRQEGGKETIEARGYKVYPIITRAEL